MSERDLEKFFKEGELKYDESKDWAMGCPEDFVIARANSILREYLAKCPMVFGHVSETHRGEYTLWCKQKDWKRTDNTLPDTHSARLVDVERIGK